MLLVIKYYHDYHLNCDDDDFMIFRDPLLLVMTVIRSIYSIRSTDMLLMIRYYDYDRRDDGELMMKCRLSHREVCVIFR